MQCPYCKIDFDKESWAGKNRPKKVCMNCLNYADIEKAKENA